MIYRIYIAALVFSFFLFAQDREGDEIIVSKSDLIDIAQSLLDSEDYPNAISIYQQILDYNMNTYGVVSDEVAQVSSIIGDLMLKANRFSDAEVYFSQALGIKSQIILINQLDLQFPLMSLREIYTINNDSTKLEEVNKTLDMIVGADSMRVNNEYWDPMTFGLQNIQSDSDDIVAGYNYSNYQSMNLINIADSYFDAELYYDAIENLLKAIIIDESNMTIDFLNKYISRHIVHVPSMMNALINFTHDDELFGAHHLFLLSLIHYQRSEDELGSYYIE